MAAVTLTDVARRAGVSLATASRVLNGSARKPAAEIAERVRDAATELGYVPNAQAQALARSTTGLIGLVVHDIADPYFSSIAKGVQRRASEERRQLLLAAAGPSEEAAAVSSFVAQRTGAIIMSGSRSQQVDPDLEAELTRYQANGGRVVTIGQRWLKDAGAVTIDNHGAGLELTEALIPSSSDRLVFLGGPDDNVSATDRRDGFSLALTRTGLSAVSITENEFSVQGGYEAATALVAEFGLDGTRGLTVIAANDVMALGAIAAFRDAGLAVPEDLRVAGFADIPFARNYSPRLTTVRLPLEGIGEMAAELALETGAPRIIRVVGEVIRRESA
ncbi:LacI family DNA-binding transcriptional regulator [Cellulosimicrobium funkei]|nr:LacI family DNA-binding transcriptional regulator [Cellulosimicrobium funkei]